jgi:hypothetical protein
VRRNIQAIRKSWLKRRVKLQYLQLPDTSLCTSKSSWQHTEEGPSICIIWILTETDSREVGMAEKKHANLE